MGKKHSKNTKISINSGVNESNKEYEIKTEKDLKKILELKEKMIKEIQEKRKNELYELLFSNVPKENTLIKKKIDNDYIK